MYTGPLRIEEVTSNQAYQKLVNKYGYSVNFTSQGDEDGITIALNGSPSYERRGFFVEDGSTEEVISVLEKYVTDLEGR